MATTLSTPKTATKRISPEVLRRRSLALLALACGVALLGAACGGGGSTPQRAGGSAEALQGGDAPAEGENASGAGYGGEEEQPEDVQPEIEQPESEVDAAEAGVTISPAQSSDGEILTANGRSIYVFDNDTNLTSNCEGECLAAWPPVDVTDGWTTDGTDNTLFATLERPDGTTQLAVNGRPLYYYSADTSPGDTNGQGVGDVWWLTNTNGIALDNNQPTPEVPAEQPPTPETPADPPAQEPEAMQPEATQEPEAMQPEAMQPEAMQPDGYCPADMTTDAEPGDMASGSDY